MTPTHIFAIESLIPESYLALLLGIAPCHQELHYTRAVFDFIKKMRQAQVWPKESPLIKTLASYERQAQHLTSLFQSNPIEIKDYLKSLPPSMLGLMAITILSVDAPYKKDVQDLLETIKQKLWSAPLLLETPLESEHFEAVAHLCSYEQQQKLVEAQLNAFDNYRCLQSTKSFDVESFVKIVEQFKLLNQQKAMLDRLIKGQWWQRL